MRVRQASVGVVAAVVGQLAHRGQVVVAAVAVRGGEHDRTARDRMLHTVLCFATMTVAGAAFAFAFAPCASTVEPDAVGDLARQRISLKPH